MEKYKTKKDSSLQNKFRFVVLNDQTFEEKFSLILTKTNVWVFLSTIAVVLIMLTAGAIIYTPLKYFIPGFGDYSYRGEITSLKFKTDSIEDALQGRQIWLENITNVLNGKVDTMRPVAPKKLDTKTANTNLGKASNDEMSLRKEVEESENYTLSQKITKKDGLRAELNEKHFFPPVEGYVTDEFSSKSGHNGIDVAAIAESPVKTTLDGTVISTTFSMETGYTIAIQHADNLITIYKHNSKIYKNIGDKVQAGEVIALVGSTGELSSGPHLHFEIWHDGRSLNPKDYIVF